MCGRFAFFRWSPSFAKQTGFPQGLDPHWNIAPGHNVVMQRMVNGQRLSHLARWGLTPVWLNDFSKTPAHARAETVLTQPMFKEAFVKRRCIVLANGFYEWRGQLRKRPFWLTSEDPMMALAAVFEAYPAGDVTFYSVALITQPALHLRRPLILNEQEQALWLNQEADPQSLAQLLENPQKTLRERPLATLVNDPSFNSPECLTPA